jgi:hypothetical protein
MVQHTGLRPRALALGFALLSLALPLIGATPARAAIAGAPSLVTRLPDLTGVSVLRQTDVGSTTGSMAKWCFDAALGNKTGSGVGTLPLGPPGVSAQVAARFHLAGYNSAQTASPLSVYVDPANTNCVDGVFEPGFQARAFTVGTADAGAVASATGLLNLADAQALLPTDVSRRPGSTTGPNLLQVLVDPYTNRIYYVFDRPILPGSAGTGTGLFFDDSNGLRHIGTFSQPLYKANFVGATFDPNTAPVADAAIIGVDTNGVRGVNGEPVGAAGETNRLDDLLGPGNTLPSAVSGGGPILVGATAVINNGSYTNQIDFTFDKGVSLPTTGQLTSFVVWKDTGAAATAAGGAVAYAGTNNPRTLRVTFPFFSGTGNQFVPQFVRASVTTDGVVSTLGVGTPGLASSMPLRASAAASGFTSGPDFQQAIKDTTGARVTLVADQPMFPNSPNPSDFVLISANGGRLSSPTSVTIQGSPARQLVLQFASSAVVSPSVAVAYVPLAGLNPVVGWPTDPAVEQMLAYTAATTASLRSAPRVQLAASSKRQVRAVTKHVRLHAT